jgi:penicillin amidase
MDIEQRAWGIHRSLDINHLARIPSFSALDLPLDGHPDALNAIGTTYGPSWRMIVALGENMEAYGVFPGGQSGNPLSRYYKLSLEKWSNLEYHSLKLFQSPEQINNPLFTVTMYN